MYILHVISSIDIKDGGPPKSVCDLANQQAINGNIVFIISIKSKRPYLINSSHPNLKVHLYNKIFFYVGIYKFISNNKIDIIHVHNLWTLPIHFTCRIAYKKNIPYVLTPRGALEPWSLQFKKTKKQIAMKTYQSRDLNRASSIHVTAKNELQNILALGFNVPVALIPNGISTKEFPLKNNKSSPLKSILFLSRIHQKKGIELLINAWDNIDESIKSNWKVIIAGNGEIGYKNQLIELIDKLGYSNHFEFVGMLSGDDKINAYHNSELFVLPTYSENFGIVVAESLSCGTPVITTKGTPWEDLAEYNAGWWIDIDVRKIAKAVEEAILLSEDERYIMGINGRKLIEQKFTINKVSFSTLQLYEWILTKENKPSFITNI